ncbi:MAG: hypothetical protein LBT94_10330, partial [Prevotellaceae bacterium]|nr:hypothetical protein [Prevotellaceae bacterium]
GWAGLKPAPTTPNGDVGTAVCGGWAGLKPAPTTPNGDVGAAVCGGWAGLKPAPTTLNGDVGAAVCGEVPRCARNDGTVGGGRGTRSVRTLLAVIPTGAREGRARGAEESPCKPPPPHASRHTLAATRAHGTVVCAGWAGLKPASTTPNGDVGTAVCGDGRV